MNDTRPASPARPTPALRLWPGVGLVVLQWFLWWPLYLLAPDLGHVGMLGALACGPLVVIWWLFFSRARWSERLGILLVMVLVGAALPRVVDASLANGMMGLMPYLYSIPLMSLGLVLGAWATRAATDRPRLPRLALPVVLAPLTLGLLRTGGMSGGSDSEWHGRWTASPEERLLAQSSASPAERPKVEAPAATVPAEWPGFRGPLRDGLVRRAAPLLTDWTATPPKEAWRQPVGPGWSSFAVHGPRVYTQEQRGEEECVTCYHRDTGAVLWRHADTIRFWESNAGAGPRGTPTLAGDRLFALGATGQLNALHATLGTLLWSRPAAADTGARLPEWGFAGSPLVVSNLVIVATAGTLAAYDIETGAPRWTGPREGYGYSSPHLVVRDGVPSVVLLQGKGAIALAPDSGNVLWQHEWKSDGIVQPTVLPGGDLLLGSGSGLGTATGVQRIAFTRSAQGWTTAEVWKSVGLKPYFCDYVVIGDHAYGFDGGMLACIDVGTGQRRWKGGRYGHGQLVGIADQALLVVISEKGEIALVRAAAEEFTELARRPAIEGKTWNHPVLVDDLLLVRNDREMAAFRLPTR